jgi:hypothetical protein
MFSETLTKYHKFGSLELNIVYEGLLLGMRVEDPKRFSQLSLTACMGL